VATLGSKAFWPEFEIVWGAPKTPAEFRIAARMRSFVPSFWDQTAMAWPLGRTATSGSSAVTLAPEILSPDVHCTVAPAVDASTKSSGNAASKRMHRRAESQVPIT
jgi:hypothetical protein